MKQLLFGFLALALMLSSCDTQPTFTLKGKIAGDAEAPLVIGVVQKDGYKTIDTLTLVEGVVDYKFTLEQPVMVVVGLEGSRQRKSFFGENVAYTIDGDINRITEATVTGGELFAAYNAIEELQKANASKSEELRMAFQAASEAGDEEKQQEIIAEYEAGEKEVEEAQMVYVSENATSPVSAYLVYSIYRHKPLDEIKAAVAKLDASLSTSPYYQSISERVAKLEKVAVGQMAPDFTMNDRDGNPVTLSSLKGNYVLIDFWASWCGPCRRENPNVVKLYNEFSEKGFDILGVSLDQKQDAWLKAIEDDQLTWNHVSDLKGWGNEAAQLYAVSGIPHTVLLDKDGKIIAKNLRGEELHNKIAELLN